MARPPKYDTEQILDAALALFAADGPRAVSVAAITRRLGAPSGSIYHRFASRDALLATLWLRTVERFQAGFLAALDHPDDERAALDAARHVLDWSRAHPQQGRLLLLYRREDLVGGGWPAEVVARAQAARSVIDAGLAAFAARLWPDPAARDMVALGLALVSIPYGAVRGFLAGGVAPPVHLDAMVVRAVRAVLFPESS